MKKLSMFVAAFALTIPVPLTLATPAQAASNSQVVGLCKDLVTTGDYPGLTVGECVSLVTTENHYYANGSSAGGFAAQACSFIQQQYPDEFAFDYESYSDCVHDRASLLI